jgi:hypothetical protein
MIVMLNLMLPMLEMQTLWKLIDTLNPLRNVWIWNVVKWFKIHQDMLFSYLKIFNVYTI